MSPSRRSTAAETTSPPARDEPATAASTGAVTARTAPAKASARATPAKAAPTKAAPTKAAPTKAASSKAAPAKVAKAAKAASSKAVAGAKPAGHTAEDADAATAANEATAAAPDLDETRRARRILRLLTARYPDARLELDFASPLQLLVAAVLAAQTLDERVNVVTPILFGRFPAAADLAAADAAEMEQILVPVGYYRQKTRNVIKLAATLVERHAGEVPQAVEELVALPWVGRKTANMVLGNAFGTPAISVDTHVSRVAHRLGWGPEKDVEASEQAIAALFERKDWVAVNLLLILHGRRTCHSRKPACGACPLAPECPSVGLGEMDPEKARALLK